MITSPAIVWFRQDLRLADNPALNHAISLEKPLLFLFILDEVSPDIRPMGAAQKWWLHHSLVSLSNNIASLGGRLLLRRGPADAVLRSLVEETGADTLCWNRRYGAGEQSLDAGIKRWFREEIGEAESFDGLLMHEPALLRTGKGDPYRVYTPFWKSFSSKHPIRSVLPVPDSLPGIMEPPVSEDLTSWHLTPKGPDWAATMAEMWVPGETGAQQALNCFVKNDLSAYDRMRDEPGPDRTSRLSPHLRFGEISPHRCWKACEAAAGGMDYKANETWKKELVWREFSYHLLHHWPNLHEQNFNPSFDGFKWLDDTASLKAWQRGQTGYPIVDAGMRQLWQTGWMHNRVRMIVASFLVKHLMIDWRHGERWFWDTLVDGDPASNPAQWQWVAGSGADAAPYFRIFNPILQGEKFDPEGEYVRRFVPEIAALPKRYIHTPWHAPKEALDGAGIDLGTTYPVPIVDHKRARERALAAFQTMRERAQN